MGSGGTLQMKEMKGPCDYLNWRECWEVYTTTLIMLKVAFPPVLKDYQTMMKDRSKDKEDCWALQNQCDDRNRHENLNDIMERENDRHEQLIAVGQ